MQQVCRKYIYKIHSSRLRTNKWNLTLSLDEARRNDEVIALANSQVLRWIDELNGLEDVDEKARAVKAKIRRIKKEANSVENTKKIRELYAELDRIQYKQDYMCLIIDRKSDYYRATKGFSINGISYKRLLGTNGGIKNSTIVFVSEQVVDELRQRIENGRDPNKELVTAKLEAYKSLACSASVPVSMPHGMLVVDDCETHFKSDIIYLTDECDGEPVMEEQKDRDIDIDATDGCGIMLPSLAERWSEELGLDYVMSGCNTRLSFEKGMVFTFDFIDFAENAAGGSYIVHDVWGDEVDIRDVELILTTSMLKLWDCYISCDDYISCCLENKYTFGITKTCPEVLENERRTNYQFVQSLDLDDDDIEELIAPTMNEIKDVLGGDWRKTVLFLKGSNLTEENIDKTENDVAKAIMIDQRMIDDPFAQSTIYQTIKNRINEAKVGALKVHGNYSIVSGDPYALCQSIFGMEVTGLLRAGEIYNGYWDDAGSDKLACFRAPMTCINNIRLVEVARREEVKYWYRYIKTATIFNAWDTAMMALNGMDYDGDLVMLTDNKVIVDHLEPLPALACAQRKAVKRISTEEDFIQSNIESFGNDIGRTTNWITSMFEVRSHYEPGSKEYETLSYRIQCGQLYQQNAIDKAKGIICKPMPQTWHDYHAVNKIEDDETREFYRSIVADKKPYFMRYIYPSLMKEYRTYVKRSERRALSVFQMTIAEMKQLPEQEHTNEQKEFIYYYDLKMPVGVGDCVINKICRRFEEEFDGCVRRHNESTDFDYTIMKTEKEYPRSRVTKIRKLYEDYNKRTQSYAMYANIERVKREDTRAKIAVMTDDFICQCSEACSNKEMLCNILLDLCYRRSATKIFTWQICAEQIIDNLLERNNHYVAFPVYDKDGELEYAGKRFTVIRKQIGEGEFIEDNYE